MHGCMLGVGNIKKDSLRYVYMCIWPLLNRGSENFDHHTIAS